ncbi:uncharacterized protein LOC134747925 [Cydia strobilella]|uniref:uncharacterized protein LOC134747925 n=1 Tax=Cydia strobilella TaxID=1100964 RepID=UPI003003BA2A
MLPMEEENAAPGEGEEGSAALHARLVALVRAAGGEPEGRVGVWMEHSYARAKSGAAVREILARPLPAEQPLDVGGPGDCDPAPDTQEPDDVDPEWEARVLALAPSAMHARAARAALEALRAFRLARLASAGHADASIKRDQARTASRAVRRALAPLWAAPNGGSGVAPWLHGAILAHGSHSAAALWRELAGEWRRSVPRAAARLLPLPAAPPRDPLARVGPPVDADKPGPWLVWICARGEDRWARRLRALLHVRVVCGDATGTGPGAGPGPSTGPEAWCSALMGAARAALLDVLAEAGSHPVVVGGAGAGAALCGALLSGAGSAGDGALANVRALALLAPPLLTAEGEATHLNRTEMELPLLVVAGSAGATCPRSLACELAAGGGTARRVLVVRGADDALRLPARLRRRLVPQHALDAAVAVSTDCDTSRAGVLTVTRRVLVVRGADDALRLPARLRRRLVPQHALDAAVAVSTDCDTSRAGVLTVTRRVLVVRGADDALRLPARLRRRLVPQHALDAAVAVSTDCDTSRAGVLTVTRRVLVVRGADDALRLPARLRRRLVPQHALDAAVAVSTDCDTSRAGVLTVTRRVLVVRGADDALRLPARLRRRLVPQHALDAAVAVSTDCDTSRAGVLTVTRRVLAVRGADDALRLPARLRRRLVPQHALDAAVASTPSL